MKNFFDWYKDKYDEEPPKDAIPGEWFHERGLPMVVHCTYCGMTMALPQAYLNREGYTFCNSCKT